MNTYDYIKDSIIVPQAAERYGMKIGRGGMVCCPFHDDRHPSMKLNERYFYCFGCGAHGDVIDLTARLLGTSTKDTISILQTDFGLDPGKELPPYTEPRRPAIHQFRQDENESAAVLTAVLHLLQQWKKEYAPGTPDDPLDDHYVLACRHTEALEYALDILSVGELEDRVSLVDRLTKTGKLEQIRKILNEYGAGDQPVSGEVQPRGSGTGHMAPLSGCHQPLWPPGTWLLGRRGAGRAWKQKMSRWPEKRVPCVHAYGTHVRTVRVNTGSSQIFQRRYHRTLLGTRSSRNQGCFITVSKASPSM